MTEEGGSPVPLRRTPAGPPGVVAYPQATWTSFDRYDRYVEIARLVRSALGPGCHRVLDVGDTAGYLTLLEPELWVAGLDVALEPDRLDGNRPLLGDGRRLPFADDTFDAVVSSDVLEHVAPDGRADFLAELQRVSRSLVVVAAPFDTPGVAGAEDLVRRYAALALGAPQPQLEEHHDNGLPQLAATYAGLQGEGWEVAVLGNGNLWDWLVSMLLRFQLEARPALDPLSQGYDELHNAAFSTSAPAAPFYRHLVVAWTDRAPELVPVDADDHPSAGAASTNGSGSGTGAGSVDLLSLAAVLVAADSTEVVRQDVNGIVAHQVLPPIAVVDAGILALHERIGGMTELLLDMSARIDHLGGAVERLTDDVARLEGRQVDTRTRLEEMYVAQMQITAPARWGRRKALALRNKLRGR